MFESLFKNLLKSQQQEAKRVQIAKSLARAYVYEEKGVDALHADMRDKVNELLAHMQAIGKPMYMFEGFRTFKRQNDLYAQGRTTAGKPIVTNARGGESYHQYGLAADIIFKDYRWSPPSDELWFIFGEKAEQLGLEWGGRWPSKDFAHVQLRPLDLTWQELKPYFEK